jgi:hypothetical protein
MQIDRSNYEIWLIDWLDGSLNEIQIGQLQQFLRENPDLKDEFDELEKLRLSPSENTFPHKNDLKKTVSELSEPQFDYLSAAYFENDLSAGQRVEVKQIIEQDQGKRKSFELIQKMRLTPLDVSYKGKNQLFRRTPLQKVILMSLIGVSAAAIIALVFVTYISIPRVLPVKTDKTAQSISGDTNSMKSPVGNVTENKTPENNTTPLPKRSKSSMVSIKKSLAEKNESQTSMRDQSDQAARSAGQDLNLINKISVSMNIDITRNSIPSTLVAFNSSEMLPEYDDGRSKLSKFIAKTFREKILKEKTPKDNRLKAYELAEAGVSGLNRLFGWEMALDKKNDENGKLKSVYFSSKILKFNAPVKNSEPPQ